MLAGTCGFLPGDNKNPQVSPQTTRVALRYCSSMQEPVVLHLCYCRNGEVDDLELSHFRRAAGPSGADLAPSETREELGDQPGFGGLSGQSGPRCSRR